MRRRTMMNMSIIITTMMMNTSIITTTMRMSTNTIITIIMITTTKVAKLRSMALVHLYTIVDSQCILADSTTS